MTCYLSVKDYMANSHIALFGSSFNPPHVGHLAVLTALAKKNLFDEIWLVPVYKHPFAKDLWPYTLRLKLAKLLLKEIRIDCPKSKISLCEIEKKLNKNPSYMFDTVTALKKKYPKIKFTLILGSDCRKDLSKWHRYKELKKIVGFYFIPRSGFEKSPFPRVSSTEVRKKLKAGKSIKGLVPRLVLGILTTL